MLDRETTPNYWLTVVAQDHGIVTLSASIEVSFLWWRTLRNSSSSSSFLFYLYFDIIYLYHIKKSNVKEEEEEITLACPVRTIESRRAFGFTIGTVSYEKKKRRRKSNEREQFGKIPLRRTLLPVLIFICQGLFSPGWRKRGGRSESRDQAFK